MLHSQGRTAVFFQINNPAPKVFQSFGNWVGYMYFVLDEFTKIKSREWESFFYRDFCVGILKSLVFYFWSCDIARQVAAQQARLHLLPTPTPAPTTCLSPVGPTETASYQRTSRGCSRGCPLVVLNRSHPFVITSIPSLFRKTGVLLFSSACVCTLSDLLPLTCSTTPIDEDAVPSHQCYPWHIYVLLVIETQIFVIPS